MRIWHWVLVASIGCADGGLKERPGSDSDPGDTDIVGDDDDDDDDDTDLGPTGDTFLGDDVGSLILTNFRTSDFYGDEIRLRGVFVDDDQGILNLADCWPTADHGCLTNLPQLDDYVEPSVDFDNLAVTFADVGASVGMGSYYALPTGNGAYAGTNTLAFPFETPLGVTVSDDWGLYIGTDDIVTPEEMVILSPPTGDEIQLVDGGQLTFRWAAGPGGTYLTVDSPSNNLQRFYLLTDDGEFTLDVNNLGLNANTPDLSFRLGRWVEEIVPINGNVLSLMVKDEQHWEVEFIDMSGRTPITPEDDCSGLLGAQVVGEGAYYGFLGGYANNMSLPSSGCTGWAADGPEGIIRIEVPASSEALIDYELLGVDASLYALTDCTDLGSCVAGEDGGGAEQISYFNASSSPVELFVVLDAFNTSGGDLFTLDVAYTPVVIELFPDTCADAMSAAAVVDGSYETTISGMANDLDPTSSGCTGVDSPGPDSIIPLDVAPGEMITVDSDDFNVAVYFVSDCSTATSCIGGQSSGDATYINTSGVTETIYAVLDHKGGSQGLFDVDVFRIGVDSLELADTCATASSVAPLAEGTYKVHLGQYANDLDPTSSGCAGTGSPYGEGMIPVSVGDDQLLTVTASTSDTSMYLLTDCTDTATCVAGDTTTLSHLNSTGATQDLFLVLDERWGQPDAFDLTVTIQDVSAAPDADTCAGASGLPPLDEGLYIGNLQGYTATMDPGTSGCAGNSSPDEEAFLKVELEPGERIHAGLEDINHELYLLTDCTDANSCVDGSNSGGSSGPFYEEIRWINATASTQTYWLVVDKNYSSTEDIYDLTIEIDTVDLIDDADTCAEAQLLPDLGPGAYSGTFDGATDALDPGTFGCAGTALSVADRMVPMTLQPGERLIAEGLGMDALYFVTDCTDTSSCLAGDAETYDNDPRLQIDNPTTSVITGFLVIDTHDSNHGVFELDITIDTPAFAATADTCSLAAAAPAYTTGTYTLVGDLSQNTDHLNPSTPGPSCTGFSAAGRDAILRVTLEDGESVHASYDGASDESIYLLTDCTNTSTCLDGDDSGSPEEIDWTNNTGTQQTYFLVLDVWGSGGGSYDLLLDIQ